MLKNQFQSRNKKQVVRFTQRLLKNNRKNNWNTFLKERLSNKVYLVET